ncbi:MAG: AbrB family transcriptional regulator [Moorea sp. SIO2B7]|nr:AbrB family transcriptional regulator [Moorena sp. SIO2B7]
MKMNLITLDPSGRVLMAKKIRQQLGIWPDTKLKLIFKDGKLILGPRSKTINLILDEACPENLEKIINDLRFERINQLSTW